MSGAEFCRSDAEMCHKCGKIFFLFAFGNSLNNALTDDACICIACGSGLLAHRGHKFGLAFNFKCSVAVIFDNRVLAALFGAVEKQL